jgi:hypothetical protein
MSLLTIMEIIGPVLLIAVLIYGTIQWSRRRRGPTEAVREGATRQLYREAAKAEAREGRKPPPAGKYLRQRLVPRGKTTAHLKASWLSAASTGEKDPARLGEAALAAPAL